MVTLDDLTAPGGLLAVIHRDATNMVALCHTLGALRVGPGLRRETFRLLVPLLEARLADINDTLAHLRDDSEDDRTARHWLVTAGAVFAEALRIVCDDLNDVVPPIVRPVAATGAIQMS